MHLRLRGDGRAVIELPLKLVIAMVVVAATASAGLGALSSYSKALVESNLRRQAESLAAAAGRLAALGANSSALLELRLDNAPLERVEYFKIGHPLAKPLHPFSGMVRFKGSGTAEGHVYVTDSCGSPLPLCSPSGGTLSLNPGNHRLLLTRLFSGALDTVFIRVEALS